MRRGIEATLILLVLASLVLNGCAPASVPISSPAPTVTEVKPAGAPSSVAPAKPAWEEEWERTINAAKREGRLVWYCSSGAEVRRSTAQAFRAKYGIPVESITGRAAELAEKLLSERRAGLYNTDVLTCGSAPTIPEVLRPAGVLDVLEPVLLLPEVLDPKVWWGDKLPWLDKGHRTFSFSAIVSGKIGVNTELVKPEEVRTWRDLLSPKWKGKMVLNDVTIGGTGTMWFTAMQGIVGLDYLRELARQEPIMIRDQRMQVEWIAKGKYPIAITPKEDVVADFERAGAPVNIIVPQEGAYLTSAGGNVSLINRAPHPNAAKLFINWLLTREAQTAWSQAYGGQTARVDVPSDFLRPDSVRQPGMKYYSMLEEERQPGKEEQKLARDIFGHLAR